MFNQAPEHFYELECNWNFRWPACWNFSIRCPEIMERGPYLVHGIGASFLNGARHPKIATLAEQWDAWDMSQPLETLTNILTEILPTAVSKYGHCSKVEGFDEALIKQLVLLNSENISL
ncbi:uncharacterized protein LOC108678973 isoform X1 [Hyalella azteca]|uniref:Uncharacterized protein LOC108678973 isoform X1 n=1 Tax=Hyalella azteca TaxID=294128 RepID=A0A8B7P9Y2_HYAAZ|nr:uncharacterized protein LOC108678973 isoform X2 [Hyalella azteca]XP_047739287.1 uncharacterized protein LOC108678973 isoform X1 [Hyalella azteca]